jgi:DNA adenine methylase
LVLTFYAFNHQIRFNAEHKFNTPFGKNRSRYNNEIRKNLVAFLEALRVKNIDFCDKNFDEFDFSGLTQEDFVYCDPPYLITVGTYNDGKRGFTGWGLKQERALLNILDNLNKRKIKFALSNVLSHKGRTNETLKEWIGKNGYSVREIIRDYANSNYHTIIRDKESTREVLIANYSFISSPSLL